MAPLPDYAQMIMDEWAKRRAYRDEAERDRKRRRYKHRLIAYRLGE